MKRLQWHEPVAYRRAVVRQNERTNCWESIKYLVVVFAGIIGFRAYLGWSQPNGNQPAWGVVIAIAAVASIAIYFVPRLFALLPNSIIILSDQGVNNNLVGPGVEVRFVPWAQIGHAVATTVSLEGRTYPALQLRAPDGRLLGTFGLRETPTVEEIRQFFRQHGKELRGSR